MHYHIDMPLMIMVVKTIAVIAALITLVARSAVSGTLHGEIDMYLQGWSYCALSATVSCFLLCSIMQVMSASIRSWRYHKATKDQRYAHSYCLASIRSHGKDISYMFDIAIDSEVSEKTLRPIHHAHHVYFIPYARAGQGDESGTPHRALQVGDLLATS